MRTPLENNMSHKFRFLGGLALLLAMIAVYWILIEFGLLEKITNGANYKEEILKFGPAGPLVIIISMTLAIVMLPIPSAPIAMASGAIFGHYWGTLYVLTGATLGAITAFFLSRLLGYEILNRWCKGKLPELPILQSQNTLMSIVFITRLIPFISFDLISYAAGLSPLQTWRFILATLAGILPASFLLAHFGLEMASLDPQRMSVSILLLGSITAIPLALAYWRSRKKKEGAPPPF